VRRGDASLAVEGRHVLGFAGGAHDAVACSVVCLTEGAQGGCTPLVEASGAEGAWVAAPPPSLLVRGILAAAEAPGWAGGIGGAVAIAIAAVVIARRPRPRA
jgi:hypothetical protein